MPVLGTADGHGIEIYLDAFGGSWADLIGNTSISITELRIELKLMQN
jgi:hypothetical protein